MEFEINSFDCTKLFVRANVVKNSKRAIIIVHGLAEHSKRYIEFMDTLAKNKISSFAFDLRGHGLSGGRRGDVESFDKLLKDLDAVHNFVTSNYKFKQLGLFGHSLGGLIVSCFCSIHHDDDFCILSSPACYVPKKAIIFRLLPYKLMKNVYIKKKVNESKTMRLFSKRDELSLKRISVRTLGAVFNEGLRFQKSKLNIWCPTLLLHGKRDILLSKTAGFEKFFARLSNPKDQFIIYPEAKHRIVQNEGKEKRIADILNWIETIK